MNGYIWLTCDNEYELFVNDKLLGKSKNWKENKNYRFNVLETNTILVKCKNRWGSAGLVANIKYDNDVIVTDNTWEVSYDQENWFPASIVGVYGMSPWKKPISLHHNTKWIWHNNRENNQTIYAKKTFSNNIKTTEKQAVSKEINNFKETWDSVIKIASEKIERVTKEESLISRFEKFITPNHPDIINKVNELNRDPKTCYRFVSDNIKYVLDEKNYEKSEFWAYPHETLAKGSGDCEDQAFLIASMFAQLNIECFVRTAYLINYQGGHAWCYFKWEDKWLAAECTSSSFDPWSKDKKPQYGPYLPWIDIAIGKSHNYTGLELIQHALRIQTKDYDDGTIKIEKDNKQ